MAILPNAILSLGETRATSFAGTGFRIDKTAGQTMFISLLNGGNLRWQWGADNVAEAGADAGSDYQLIAYADSGALLGTALSINRATQAVTIPSLAGAGTRAVMADPSGVLSAP